MGKENKCFEDYLKPPDYEVRCDKFVEEVKNDIAPKYPTLGIDPENETTHVSPIKPESDIQKIIDRYTFAGKSEKQIQEIPFPRLSYKEAMEKYNSDRPDLRKDKNNSNLLAFCWVVDFPFFEKTEEGHWTFTHNPFSAPKPEYMELLLKQEKISEILTTQYDVVLNGTEVGGGSIRNHRPDALEAVFEIMGFAKERIKDNFGHMLDALGYGAPPHGGIAWGLDRLIALLNNEPNIREVIAFPKTGDARDLMMESPSELDKKQLKELHLKIEK